MQEETKPKLLVAPCDYKAAKYAVEHWHYSKCLPRGKMVSLGVWENQIFIGCVIFSLGNNQYQGNFLGLKSIEICELARVALTKHQSSVSQIVSIALKKLKQENSGLRAVFSYADPMQGHTGGIYQAMNWVYIGTGGSKEAFITNSGKKVHSRLISPTGYKSHFGKMHKTYTPDEVTRVELEPKHKYLYPLDKAMRKQIEPLAKPYPKREHANG